MRNSNNKKILFILIAVLAIAIIVVVIWLSRTSDVQHDENASVNDYGQDEIIENAEKTELKTDEQSQFAPEIQVIEEESDGDSLNNVEYADKKKNEQPQETQVVDLSNGGDGWNSFPEIPAS